jgi:hypothetical protein
MVEFTSTCLCQIFSFVRELHFFLILSHPFSSPILPMAHDEGTDSDGMGDIYPTSWKANLTKVDERWVKLNFYIPKSVKLRFDDGK